jgi:hypothetical protein
MIMMMTESATMIQPTAMANSRGGFVKEGSRKLMATSAGDQKETKSALNSRLRTSIESRSASSFGYT